MVGQYGYAAFAFNVLVVSFPRMSITLTTAVRVPGASSGGVTNSVSVSVTSRLDGANAQAALMQSGLAPGSQKLLPGDVLLLCVEGQNLSTSICPAYFPHLYHPDSERKSVGFSARWQSRESRRSTRAAIWHVTRRGMAESRAPFERQFPRFRLRLLMRLEAFFLFPCSAGAVGVPTMLFR